MTCELRARVVLLGDSTVGKTSIVERLKGSRFEEVPLTIGVDYHTYRVETLSRPIELQCWDIAGQERFRSVCESYYRGVAAALLVFDLNNVLSFKSLKFWLSELSRCNTCSRPLNSDFGPPVLLVGNKSDQPLRNRQVSGEEIGKFTAKYGIPAYFEVSAKTGDGVVQPFRELAQQLLSRVSSAQANNLDLSSLLRGISQTPVTGDRAMVRTPTSDCC